ncbi:MAG: hypothetical protein ABW360_09910 [Phenylobacterium sp.]
MTSIGRGGVAAAALAFALALPGAGLARPTAHAPAVALDLNVPGAETAKFRSPEAGGISG